MCFRRSVVDSMAFSFDRDAMVFDLNDGRSKFFISFFDYIRDSIGVYLCENGACKIERLDFKF